MVKIDYRDGRPIYEQVADGIEELALRGALPAETQLPSVRQFAMELSINPNTIQRAYGELERRGVIYAAKGRGPFSATYLKTRIVTLLHQRKSLQEMYMAQLTESKNAIISGNLTPSQPQITPFDKQFMQKVMGFMEQQMDNSELTIDAFAEHLMMSRTIFYRKLKSIIGLTPVDFIREIRIKRAVQLIDSGEYNFSQIAYMTGFSDPKYFSKCFKKVMGVTPSEYKERK